jgi:hypothetical protein
MINWNPESIDAERSRLVERGRRLKYFTINSENLHSRALTANSR